LPATARWSARESAHRLANWSVTVGLSHSRGARQLTERKIEIEPGTVVSVPRPLVMTTLKVAVVGDDVRPRKKAVPGERSSSCACPAAQVNPRHCRRLRGRSRKSSGHYLAVTRQDFWDFVVQLLAARIGWKKGAHHVKTPTGRAGCPDQSAKTPSCGVIREKRVFAYRAGLGGALTCCLTEPRPNLTAAASAVERRCCRGHFQNASPENRGARGDEALSAASCGTSPCFHRSSELSETMPLRPGPDRRIATDNSRIAS